MTRRTILWTAAALLGIAITAAVAWAASQLAAQRIGLASAPLSVQRGLAPRALRPTRHPVRAGEDPRAQDRARVSHHSSSAPPPVIRTTPAPASTGTPAPSPPPPAPPASAPAPQSQSGTGGNPPPSHSRGGQDDGGGGSGNGGGSSGPDD